MSYIDGVVIAVPTTNREKFIEHSNTMDAAFIEYGATRVVEGWGEDVPTGKKTDFRRAVQASDEETIVFSWIEWPDKATRDQAWEKLMADPRMNNENNPMPFDGARMIYGGFESVLDLGGTPR